MSRARRNLKASHRKATLKALLRGIFCAITGLVFFCAAAQEPGYGSAGLLRASDWHAQWIGLDGVEQTNWLENAYPGFEGARTRLSWIWFPAGEPEKSAPPGKFYFRREIVIPAGKPPIKEVHFQFAGDSECRGWINGFDLGTQKTFRSVRDADVTGRIEPGTNLICLAGINDGGRPKPAGVIAYLEIEFTKGDSLIFWTDEQWKVSDKPEPGWNQSGFDDAKWAAAKALGPVGMPPWGNVRVPESRRLPARYLRKDFFIGKKAARATVYFSGLGWSELYLNGEKVGNSVLSPAITDYSKRVFYVARDVTKQLRGGTNTFGAILGNGAYYAPRSEIFSGAASFGWPKMKLQLRVEYSDGSVSEVVSDKSWQITTQGPIRANNLFDGEEYDANYDLTGWDSPGYEAVPFSPPQETAAARNGPLVQTKPTNAFFRKYNPPPGTAPPGARAWKTQWQPAQIVSAPVGKLVAEMAEPVHVAETIRPVTLTEPQPGAFVFDMGRSITGWCRLKVSGPAESQVMLRHAQTLNRDGALNLAELDGAKATDIYILRGTANGEVWEPRFTYHIFRYVEVTGYPGRPTNDSIEGRVLTPSPGGH